MTTNPKTLKTASSVILTAVATAFVADGHGVDVLDNFIAVSGYDAYGWAALLLVLAAGQAALLRCSDCLKCRTWGDLLLQLSGLVLLIIGLMFIAAYPPFSWLMGAFPILGMLFVLVGRILGNESRSLLAGKEHDE